MADSEYIETSKVPAKVSLYFYMIFFLGDLLYAVPLLANKIVTFGEIVRFATYWIYVIYILTKYAALFIWYGFSIFLLKKCKENPTEENLKKADIIIRVFTRFPLIVQGCFVLSIMPGLAMISDAIGVSGHHISTGLIYIGTSGIFGCLCNTLYLKYFEEWVSFCKFTTDSKIYYSNVERGAISSVVTLLSPIFIAAGCIMGWTGDATEIRQLFINGLVPVLVGNAFFSAVSILTLFKQNSNVLKSLSDSLKKIAKNDYTVEIKQAYSRDELGLITHAVSEMVSSTKELLHSIQENTMKSHEMARELAVQSEVTNKAVEKIMGSTDAMNESVASETDAFGKIDSIGQQVTDAMNNLNEDIQSQASAVLESSSAIEQMVSNIKAVTNILNKNADTVKSLADAAVQGKQKIAASVTSAENILKDSAGLVEASTVIMNIAEQTNLLAMNAAIEAAHAGETGKGFAVVANEIRKLAEDSNKQGKVITDSLEKLQESIKEIGSSTGDVQSSFNTIFELTNKVQEQEDTIKTAMDEQSTGSEQVLTAVKQITNITNNVSNGSKTMIDNNNNIRKGMETLAKETENFNITMNDVSKSAAEIARASADSSRATGQNNIMVQKLKEEVCKFKI